MFVVVVAAAAAAVVCPVTLAFKDPMDFVCLYVDLVLFLALL